MYLVVKGGKFFNPLGGAKLKSTYGILLLHTFFLLNSVFWGDILEISNKTSKKLQSVSIDLITVVQLYDSITHCVKSALKRSVFIKFENSAKKII